jgi:sulfite reductase beta subunit-like hemoprotein
MLGWASCSGSVPRQRSPKLPKLSCLCKETTEIVQIENMPGSHHSYRTYDSLKYTIDDMGLDEFKRKVEERLGKKVSPARKHQPFTKNIDDFSGWVKGDDGLYSHTIFIENGTKQR